LKPTVGFMTHITCMLTAKNRDQLRNPTLGNLVRATFTFFPYCNKCQLSLMDPRNGILLYTELDDYCDKLVVERRSSEVLSTWLTDNGPVYHAVSVHLSGAKLRTRFDGRYALAKFSQVRSLGQSSRGKCNLIFGDTRVFF